MHLSEDSIAVRFYGHFYYQHFRNARFEMCANDLSLSLTTYATLHNSSVRHAH
jgi:hypothetical protein